jgi:drug/metabolite transporter (DMT)-like permease
MPTASLVVAVPAAIAGAACMGLASAAQSRATKQVPDHATLHPRLLWHLIREPIWLIGIAATVVGLGLQVVALGFGPLIMVQPLLVCALPFATFFAAVMARHRVDRVIVLGAFVCVAGLSAFLLLARPSGGTDHLIAEAPLATLAIGLGVVALGGILMSLFVKGPMRVLGLALTTGVFYGMSAGLMKVVAGELRVGVGVPLHHWSLYTLLIIGPVGFLLSQNTFQQGRMVAPALAVITTVDPLVGIAIGVWWLGEFAHTGTVAVTGELLGALVIVVGIAVLSRRAEEITPHRAERNAATEREPSPDKQPGQPTEREPDAPPDRGSGRDSGRSSNVQHFGPPPDLRSSERSTKTGR